jgi:hypothetical protein
MNGGLASALFTLAWLILVTPAAQAGEGETYWLSPKIQESVLLAQEKQQVMLRAKSSPSQSCEPPRFSRRPFRLSLKRRF